MGVIAYGRGAARNTCGRTAVTNEHHRCGPGITAQGGSSGAASAGTVPKRHHCQCECAKCWHVDAHWRGRRPGGLHVLAG